MFRCPHCGQTYDTTLFSAGEMFCCLHCGKPFVIDSVRPAKHAQRQTRPQRPQTSSHTRPNPTAAPSSRPEILAYQSMTTIGQSLVSFFTTWGIKGRCSRSEFWWGILWALFFCLIFLYLISRLLVFLFHQESLGDYIIARLALCLLFIKLTSLLCRRLHDIGWRSTHLMVGTGIVCALLCVPGPPPPCRAYFCGWTLLLLLFAVESSFLQCSCQARHIQIAMGPSRMSQMPSNVTLQRIHSILSRRFPTLLARFVYSVGLCSSGLPRERL